MPFQLNNLALQDLYQLLQPITRCFLFLNTWISYISWSIRIRILNDIYRVFNVDYQCTIERAMSFDEAQHCLHELQTQLEQESQETKSIKSQVVPIDCRDSAVQMENSYQVSTICAHLIKIFRDFEMYKKFLSYRGGAAQDLLDLLQKILDHAPLEPDFRVILYVALVRLCRKSELYPRCFYLADVDVELSHLPVTSGAFGDVYKAHHNGKAVCLKVVKLYRGSEESILYKAYAREAVVWGQLSHPNVLPFYGIHHLSDPNNRLCLVSPWISNGNIQEYLENPARLHLDRTPLISDVGSGMKYLHENGVVHGDLKSLNILVTESEHACLADFGLLYITESSGLGGPALSSRQAGGGTVGFEAPELTDPMTESDCRRTEASDVYAFGMVCYEIFTGKQPFGKLGPLAVTMKARSGERPSRPIDSEKVYLERGLTDTIWSLMERCWSQSPENRPAATQIVQLLPPSRAETNLQTDNWEWTCNRRPGFEMSDGQADATIASALSHLKQLL